MDIKKKEAKKNILGKLKRKKIAEYYISLCDKKINVMLDKEFALEQLNITSMQIDALKNTVSIFKTFNKNNNYKKIEELQSQYEELTDDITDINDMLQNQPYIDIDDDELENELNDLIKEPLKMPISTTEDLVQNFPICPNDHMNQTDAVENKLLPNVL
tara:strand:- start:154 stop:630 length:477 start_codon:yes stop_codon:yes gene_type:complete